MNGKGKCKAIIGFTVNCHCDGESAGVDTKYNRLIRLSFGWAPKTFPTQEPHRYDGFYMGATMRPPSDGLPVWGPNKNQKKLKDARMPDGIQGFVDVVMKGGNPGDDTKDIADKIEEAIDKAEENGELPEDMIDVETDGGEPGNTHGRVVVKNCPTHLDVGELGVTKIAWSILIIGGDTVVVGAGKAPEDPNTPAQKDRPWKPKVGGDELKLKPGQRPKSPRPNKYLDPWALPTGPEEGATGSGGNTGKGSGPSKDSIILNGLLQIPSWSAQASGYVVVVTGRDGSTEDYWGFDYDQDVIVRYDRHRDDIRQASAIASALRANGIQCVVDRNSVRAIRDERNHRPVLGIGYINLPNLEPMGWAKPQHIVIERSRELEDEHKSRGPLSRLNPADINSRSDLTAGVVAHAAPRLANLEE